MLSLNSLIWVKKLIVLPKNVDVLKMFVTSRFLVTPRSFYSNYENISTHSKLLVQRILHFSDLT
jgi:hypothetical protein